MQVDGSLGAEDSHIPGQIKLSIVSESVIPLPPPLQKSERAK